ncbi:MAG: hypothetical protein FJZ58_05005 [Chlamydiae bacterium]|nr:hypothetical protein [Chlamydiota bacterium]
MSISPHKITEADYNFLDSTVKNSHTCTDKRVAELSKKLFEEIEFLEKNPSEGSGKLTLENCKNLAGQLKIKAWQDLKSTPYFKLFLSAVQNFFLGHGAESSASITYTTLTAKELTEHEQKELNKFINSCKQDPNTPFTPRILHLFRKLRLSLTRETTPQPSAPLLLQKDHQDQENIPVATVVTDASQSIVAYATQVNSQVNSPLQELHQELEKELRKRLQGHPNNEAPRLIKELSTEEFRAILTALQADLSSEGNLQTLANIRKASQQLQKELPAWKTAHLNDLYTDIENSLTNILSTIDSKLSLQELTQFAAQATPAATTELSDDIVAKAKPLLLFPSNALSNDEKALKDKMLHIITNHVRHRGLKGNNLEQLFVDLPNTALNKVIHDLARMVNTTLKKEHYVDVGNSIVNISIEELNHRVDEVNEVINKKTKKLTKHDNPSQFDYINCYIQTIQKHLNKTPGTYTMSLNTNYLNE